MYFNLLRVIMQKITLISPIASALIPLREVGSEIKDGRQKVKDPLGFWSDKIHFGTIYVFPCSFVKKAVNFVILISKPNLQYFQFLYFNSISAWIQSPKC